MSENEQQLPSEWGKIKLTECATLITKGTTPTTHGYEYRNEGIRFVRVEHFSNGVIDTSLINQFISQHAHDFLKRSQLCEGDVLVSIAGTIGRVAIVRNFDTPANTNQAVGIIRGVEQVFYPPFLGSLLASPYVQKSIRNRKRGGGMNNISLEDLRDLSVPVPPFPEQLRIAEALDELFSDLDAAVSALKRVRAKLKLYRASVLKAAVEGDLTAEWRERQPHIEPASELLQRILIERRRHWEDEQLRKFEEKGKEPPKNWQTKYDEPVAPKTDRLPSLPEGWCWATLEQVSILVTDGDHNPPKRISEGVPHLTARNVKNLKLSLEKCSFISPGNASRVFRRYHPERSDLIITCVGTVGRTAIVPEGFEFSPDRNLAAVRLCNTGPNVAYVQYFVEAPQTQAVLMSASGSTAQPHLYLGDLRRLVVALPSAGEQEVIVETVEHQLSIIDHLEADFEAKLRGAEALRQSILGHAFTGQLVPQDPNDEPASELLKRIAAEREARARKVAAAKRATAKPTTSRKKPRREIAKRKRSSA